MTTLDGMCRLVVDTAGYLMCGVCLLSFYSSGTLKSIGAEYRIALHRY